MPCYEPEDPVDKARKEHLARGGAILCEMLTIAESVLGDIDKAIKGRAIKEWWAEHKALDAKRGKES